MNGKMGNKELMEHLLHVAVRFQKVNIAGLIEGLSHNEIGTLEMIGRFMLNCPGAKGIFVTDLAKCRGSSPPAVSRTLRSLEEKGLIGRKTDTNDRRNTYVFLTKEGLKKREEIAKNMELLGTGVMARMGTEKTEMLIKLWGELENIIVEEAENLSAQNKKSRRS